MQAQMHHQASCCFMERALPKKEANVGDSSVERGREENCALVISGVRYLEPLEYENKRNFLMGEGVEKAVSISIYLSLSLCLPTYLCYFFLSS